MSYKTKIELWADKFVKIGGTNEDGTVNAPSLEGYYLGSQIVDGDYGPKTVHYIQTGEGVMGVPARGNLDRILTKDHTGQMVLVTFERMRAPAKKGRKASYVYSLKYDTENTIDVSGISLPNQEDQSSEQSSSSSSSEEDSFEEESLNSEEASLDEVVTPKRAVVVSSPRPAPTSSSNAALQAKALAMLNKSKIKQA